MIPIKLIPCLFLFISCLDLGLGGSVEAKEEKQLRGLQQSKTVDGVVTWTPITYSQQACLTEEQCWQRYKQLNLGGSNYYRSEYATKGCFTKGDNVFFGIGGSIEEMSSTLKGKKQRVWCDENWRPALQSQDMITISPAPSLTPTTNYPTESPTTAEPTTEYPTYTPTTKTYSPTHRDDDFYEWNHGSFGVSAERSGTITIDVPDTAQIGDTLFVFLSRSDGQLPLNLNYLKSGWKRGGECFKSDNGDKQCFRASDCIERDGAYCTKFQQGAKDGSGRDLATVLFYQTITETANNLTSFNITVPHSKLTTWATVAAITNVNQTKPIVAISTESCDRDGDSEFPTVYGKENDVILLSQCFDDTALKRHFKPPPGTELLGWTNSEDEAGFLYGKKLTRNGHTGELETIGKGGSKCKDALISVVVNRN